jgi:arsenite methyltransferase
MSEDNDQDTVREAVRDRYAEIAKTGSSCCGGSPCCGSSGAEIEGDTARLARKAGHAESLKLGYTEEELAAAPEGADLGLGCGNPQAIAALKPGEVVLDLGAGAGFDCFLAARAIGSAGRVIGVDMTPEMVSRARENARKAGYDNVDFRLGEIEHLPVADGTVDVIISNCVINLSPDKPAVFREAFRVLKTGGRLAVSDVVATAELPREWRDDMRLLSACISGAATVAEVEAMLTTAGFVEISISPKEQSREFIQQWEPGRKLEDYVLSASICARKGRPKEVDDQQVTRE